MKVLTYLLSLAFLAELGIGAYLALTWVAAALGLTGQLATVAVIAVLAILLAGLFVASSVRVASQRRSAQALHAERVVTYQLFVDVWGALLERGIDGSTSYSDLPAERRALDRLMTLYGGSGVLKAHTALRTLEIERGMNDPAVRRQFAQALIEIREDLGLDARSVSVSDLEQILCSEFNAVRPNPNPKANAAPDGHPRVSLASHS